VDTADTEAPADAGAGDDDGIRSEGRGIASPSPLSTQPRADNRKYTTQPRRQTMLKITTYAALLFLAAFALRQLDGSLPQVIPYAFALVVVPLVALHLLLKDVTA